MAKRINWTLEETKILIDIWENNYQYLRSMKRNKSVFDKMAEDLKEFGIERSTKQIQMKIDSLTQMYRRTKRELTTGSAPPKWPLYLKVHHILGQSPSNDQSLTNDTLQDHFYFESERVEIENNNPGTSQENLISCETVLSDISNDQNAGANNETDITEETQQKRFKKNDYLKNFLQLETKYVNSVEIFQKEEIDILKEQLKLYKESLAIQNRIATVQEKIAFLLEKKLNN